MSPLAPQLVNGNRSFDSSTPSNLIEIVSKQTYSVGSLYDMRHNQSRAPNLGNRNVLASISRPNVTPSLRLPGAFRLSLSTPSLNQFERDPRPSNHQRPIARHNSTQGNGNRSNSGDSHGERYRPANRGKLRRVTRKIQCICNVIVRLCWIFQLMCSVYLFVCLFVCSFFTYCCVQFSHFTFLAII